MIEPGTPIEAAEAAEDSAETTQHIEPQKRSLIPQPVDKKSRLEELTAKISNQSVEQTARDMLARERQNERLTKLRGIDPLTELYAPFMFKRTLAREVRIVERDETSPGMGLALIDLDKFGDFNKDNGKMAGDEVLNHVGKTLNRSIRGTDLAFREGGEELAVIMPYTNEGPSPDTEENPTSETKDPAGRLRIAIEASESPKGFKVTASVGQTDYIEGEKVETFYQRADRARRMAKQLGRNRTVKATEVNGMLFAHDLTENRRYSVEPYMTTDEKGREVEMFKFTPLESVTP